MAGRGRIATAKRPQADPPTRVEPWTAASSAEKAAGWADSASPWGSQRPSAQLRAGRAWGPGEPQPEVLASGPEEPRRKPTARGTCSSAPGPPGLPAHALAPGAGTRYRAPTPQRPLRSGSGPHHCGPGGGRPVVRVRTVPLRPGRGRPVVRVRTVPPRPRRGWWC